MKRGQSIDDRQSFRFAFEYLYRKVKPRNGDSYEHSCFAKHYQNVAHCIEQYADQGITTNMLWDILHDIPCTQVSVAIAFMKERDCLAVRRRRMFPASNFFWEDAMLELTALKYNCHVEDLFWHQQKRMRESSSR